MEAVAIIGIGCRFPKAKNPEEFWQVLREGVDAITEVPSDRWDIDAIYKPGGATAGKMNTRWGGFLEQVAHFDPSFFGITAYEAERMDPQHRLFLEVAWEALENAGIIPAKLAGSRTGVFVGISNSDYHRLITRDFYAISPHDNVGNSLCIAANRLSYILNLRGPSIAIDTACSSSLVAIHYACQSLQSRESNFCLVGGVNLILSPEGTIGCSQAGMMAVDGRCKTFDASADGYVRSEGCGVVVLKRFSDAFKDGDKILAIIKGSAVNQDGMSNGLTAPNGSAQQEVIRQALENAGLTPASISHVETHAVGTLMGDAIEVKSLKSVLMPSRSPDQSCTIGSVKTNIGHLEAAAGIASLIKVVLSLQYKEIPRNLHLKTLNRYISLKETTFSIPTEHQSWSSSTERRIAGVSAFSVGGTNCHVILEESLLPTAVCIESERPQHLLTLGANSDKALQEIAQSYKAYLDSHPKASLANICFTANTGRSQFNHRLAIIAESTDQLCEQLVAFTTKAKTSQLFSKQVNNKRPPKIAFFFSGDDCQYVGMGHQLYQTQSTFRATLEHCDEILRSYLERPLLSVLYPEEAEISSVTSEIAYIQPALFALEYALFQLWKSWGIEPGIVMGDGVGEYVAACVAGVFSLEDSLKLIVSRAFLTQGLSQEQDAESMAAFKQVAQEVAYSCPQISLISNVTKKLANADIATPEYWSNHRHLLSRSAAKIEILYEEDDKIFVEIGAASVTLLEMDWDSRQKGGIWLSSLYPKKTDWQQMLQTLAILYVHGVRVDWLGFDRDYMRHRIALPTYPFQRERYWFKTSENIFSNPLASSDFKLNEQPKISKQQSQALKLTKNQIVEPTMPIFTSNADSIQDWIINWLAKRLNIEVKSLDASKSFADYGLDSLNAVDLVKNLEEELQRSLEITIIWNFPTIESLANYLANEKNVVASSFEGLTDRQFQEEEIELDPTITCDNADFTWAEESVAILLTGTTGFLGAFLLDELLHQTHADIYCLVRSSNVESAMSRLKKNLEHYGIWNENFINRIIPIVGDISKFQLGLSNEQFQQMASQIDTIYHSAALVNYAYPYSRCRPHNVLGTQEVLRFASHTKIKTVHHISTGGVFGSATYYGNVVTESDQLVHRDGIHLGYSQSKWVAEKLVMAARERGLPVCTYRIQFISGHSQTGAVNANNLLITLLIKGFIEIGIAPDIDYEVNICPVDFVAKAIVHLSKKRQSLGKAFHIQNTQPIHWNRLFNWIKDFGYPIEQVSYEILLENIHRVVRSREYVLYPLLPFIVEKRSHDKLTILELYQKARRPEIICQKTLDSLADTSIVCPPINGELLDIYFSYLIHHSFLNAPSRFNNFATPSVTVAKNTFSVSSVLTKTSWLHFPKVNLCAPIRLFCFHNGGGDASLFSGWLDVLSPKIEVCPIQLPGRSNRLLEQPFTRVSAIVETLAKELHPYLKVPFAFFGHSMGATISFELAREIRRQYGISPIYLFVSAAQAPHILEPLPFSPPLEASDFEIVEGLRRMGSTPEWVLQDTKLLQSLIPTIRADLQVVSTYTYSPSEPLDCPICAFGGLEDPLVTQEYLAAWRDQTKNSFTLQMFPGDHFFLHKARSLIMQFLSDRLSPFL